PIPTPDLRLVSRPARPLSELDVGQEGYIRRVRISAPERVEALAAEGVAPNVRVRVLDHREQACVVQIVVSGREVVIVPDEACDVLIEPLPEVENEEG
ncbi:FeoA family protein, partial [Ardenticatena maritima]